MSTNLHQYMFYGVKVPYDHPKHKAAMEDESYDDIRAEDVGEIGWLVDGMSGEFALYGQVLLEGEDNGSDYVIAGESGTVEIPILSGADKLKVDSKIEETFNMSTVNKARYYIVGLWG